MSVISTFTSSGTLDIPAGVTSVTYLIVAGGGGGAVGGGGAGGVLQGTCSVSGGQSYPVVVGRGGNGSLAWGGDADSGLSSSFNGLTAIGGGGGNHNTTGKTGGSGGGGGYGASGGLGTSGQGYNGGNGLSGGNYPGGGGGGAGAIGGTAPNTSTGGSGGIGITSSISGIATNYAGGGGGGTQSGGTGGTASYGGGAGGGSVNGSSGVPNTGGGGGGGRSLGGRGGSGIVIISYEFTNVISPLCDFVLGGYSSFLGHDKTYALSTVCGTVFGSNIEYSKGYSLVQAIGVTQSGYLSVNSGYNLNLVQPIVLSASLTKDELVKAILFFGGYADYNRTTYFPVTTGIILSATQIKKQLTFAESHTEPTLFILNNNSITFKLEESP